MPDQTESAAPTAFMPWANLDQLDDVENNALRPTKHMPDAKPTLDNCTNSKGGSSSSCSLGKQATDDSIVFCVYRQSV